MKIDKMNKKILIAGILLYVLVAPFFYHSDIKEIYFKSQFLSQGVFNIYSYIEKNPNAALFGPFSYQPLTYFVFGILFLPVRFLAGNDFQQWLAMGNDAVGVAYLPRYLFLMKLPLIAVFSASGYILSKLFVSTADRSKVLLLWFFNPISIYVIALVGQFDIFPVFLCILALTSASKRPLLSAALLGLGAAMKGYPLFLIPFLTISIDARLSKRIIVALVGVFTFLFTISPFMGTKSFYTSAALSGLSQRMFIPGISFGFDENFLIVPGVYLLLVLLVINFSLGKVKSLYKYFFASSFLLASAVHFHAQWALWYLPFLIILLVRKSRFSQPFYAFSSFVLTLSFFSTIFLLKDRFLTVGLFSVFDSSVLYLPSPFEIISKFYDPFVVQSVSHTMYLVSGLAMATKVIYERNSK